MAVTSIDIDPAKLEQFKRLTGAESNREAVDVALGVRRKRELVEWPRIEGSRQSCMR